MARICGISSLWCCVFCCLLWLFEGCAGLQCYSCHYENESDVCMETKVTCQYGEVCLNVVYRHSLFGTLYTKGCKLGKDCYKVQALNDDNYCKTTPSECAYCCENDLCNDASNVVTSFAVLVTCVVTACVLRR